MAFLDALERCTLSPLLAGLDRLRRRVLAISILRPFVRDRRLRVVAMAAITSAAALAGAIFAPGYLLLLGPLALGVPHLFAEARYLAPRDRLETRLPLVALLLAQSVCVVLGVGLHTVGVAAALGWWIARHRAGRSVGALVPALLAVAQAACWVGPISCRFLLLHAHNCAPIVVWALWRRRPSAWSVGVVSLFALGAVAILLGVGDGVPIRTPLDDHAFSLSRLTDAVAGGFAAPWRHRFLCLFCYTQAIHYAIWLRLIPEEARERETPRSWASSWRTYKAAAGDRVAWAAIGGTLGVIALALLVGAVRARAWYVGVSEFHATAEIVLLAALAGRG